MRHFGCKFLPHPLPLPRREGGSGASRAAEARSPLIGGGAGGGVALGLLFFFACQTQIPENQVFVNAEQTALRAAPSEKSRELAALKNGQALRELGEVSRTESRLRLGEALFQTPWLKVQTTDGLVGWAFAGALRPAADHADWLLQKRLECYFGPALAARRNAWAAAPAPTGEQQFADHWREAVALRDTLLHTLGSRPEPDFQPDFEWLRAVLPGFVFQKVAEGTRPWLFADYRFWQQKALKTNGLQDDALLEACLAAFPQDSIESFFPAWQFQYSDYESASQLGSGAHLQMLLQIDRAAQNGTIFAPELAALKEQLLDDILQNTRYWQSKEKVLTELGQIFKDRPNCLSERDYDALAIRQPMFEDPTAHGLRLNLRTGE
jgi:hypothetical protein